ncbi:EH domain-binding protein 1, partial [Bienertia sinuspersici]
GCSNGGEDDEVEAMATADEEIRGVLKDEDLKDDLIKLMAEIRWKGTPNNNKVALMRRRSVKRDFTSIAAEKNKNNGVFEWDEEFQSVCSLSTLKDNCSSFHPWEIGFCILDGTKSAPKNKVSVLATASLNLAEYASITEQEFDLSIPLTVMGNDVDPCPSLHISLSLLELRTAQDSGDSLQQSIVPVSSPPHPGETLPSEKDELSALKAGLRKVKILTEYVSSRRAKKSCREEDGSEGRCSSRSEDGDYLFDSDSFDEFGEGETDEGKEDASLRKSFSYGTLAYANHMGGSFFSSTRVTSSDEDWIYYSHRKSDVGCSINEDSTSSGSEPPLVQTSKRSILPWRKRKQIFRSPKAKGEPLLKKAYAEEGGDDIDFDRRQLSSDESISFGWNKSEDDLAANRPSVSEFGDDSFAVGSWEQKEIVSRDGQMKLYAEVFFASIDQRSERAAGESACTALVAVIADWFHNNCGIMPIKSQFDSLIRDGSLEWRKLCENETYRERFPDKHFDLETVLQAKIRPLSVHPGKSFIGFFHPEETVEGKFDFLQGAMSFDGIWDEISHSSLECPSYGDPNIYIISWNDHFFILKVETDAYYIIDTLGERLYEGCNQAYVLKFDRNTKIVKLPDSQPSEEKPTVDQPTLENGPVEEPMKSGEEELVCQGKEVCKDYIKNFMAALPIRELLADLKKGLLSSPPLHRLQVECHYTQFLPPPIAGQLSAADVVAATPNLLPLRMEVAISEVAAA